MTAIGRWGRVNRSILPTETCGELGCGIISAPTGCGGVRCGPSSRGDDGQEAPATAALALGDPRLGPGVASGDGTRELPSLEQGEAPLEGPLEPSFEPSFEASFEESLDAGRAEAAPGGGGSSAGICDERASPDAPTASA